MNGIREKLKRTEESTVFHLRKRPQYFRMQGRSPSTTQTIQRMSRVKSRSACRQRAVCCFSRIAIAMAEFGS
jgi:hypothetical protein